jgi:phage shock protein A
MGLLERMGTVLKSKMNALVEHSENPAETLEYSYEKQRDLLINVKKGLVEVVTSKRQLELQSEKLQEQAGQLDKQAAQALSVGREDLARVALQRKQLVLDQLEGLAGQVDSLAQEQEKLTLAEGRLNAKVDAFRSRKETIKAQYTAAQAQVRIGEAVHGLSEEMADMGLAIERAESKTEQMRARAIAIDELAESGTLTDLSGTGGDNLSAELRQLSASQNVDLELESLKKRLNSGQPPKQLEAGR